MAYAVELYLDSDSAGKVHAMWQMLADEGIFSSLVEGGFRPHASLCGYEQLPVESFVEELSAFAQRIPALSVNLSHLGIFPSTGVVFLGVTVSDALLHTHRDFHQTFSLYARTAWSHYLPAQWVPHCTLAFRLPTERIPRAVELCQRSFEPFTGRFEEIGLIEVPSRKVCGTFGLTGEW